MNLVYSLKKKLPFIYVVGGGPDVNSDFNYCIDWVDFVCLGDGEVAFPKLCRVLLENRDVTKEDLPNIFFRRGGKLYQNRLIAEDDIDRYEFPFFSDTDIYEISSNALIPHRDSSNKTYNVYASRGCPYKCSYCSNHLFSGNYPGKRYYRARSVQNVIDEILSARQKNAAINTIIFHDEQFGLNKKWFEEFIIKYKRNIDLPFFVQMNPKDLAMDKADKMKHCGLQLMSFGVQSASPRIRELYDRPEALNDVQHANAILHKLRIPHFFDLIVDNPVEKVEDLEETLLFLFRLKKPFVAKTFDLIHLPKTKLTNYLLENKLIQEDNVEGNYEYDKEINWRVTGTDTTMTYDQQFVVALIHLTGNLFVPNRLINFLLNRRDKIPPIVKSRLTKLTLSKSYYYKISIFNYAIGLILEKRFLFVFHKTLSKIIRTIKHRYVK
jgi:radical SAM superfamily enzyme YgiQ (UPF0313 family)